MFCSLIFFAALQPARANNAATAKFFMQDTETEDVYFLEGFEDLPLLPNFQMVEDSHIIFDTPAGTIADVTLFSKQNNGLQLYKDSIVNLGWTCTAINTAAKTNQLRCQKNATRLSIIKMHTDTDGHYYHFSHKPNP